MSRPNAREIILAVISRATRHAYGKSINPGCGAHRVITSRTESEAWVRDRIGQALISLDIEGDASPVTVHPSRHNVLCLGLHDGKETVVLPEELFATNWEVFADLLEAAITAAHNGPFDSSVLGWVMRSRNQPIKITHDTMFAHYALWPAGGDDADHEDSSTAARAYHGLKLLGDLYLGCGDWSLTQTQYRNMRDVPLEELYTYNAKDVQRTDLLMKIFRDQFRHAPRQLALYTDVLMPASHHLTWQKDSGLCVDQPYAADELVPGMLDQVHRLTRDLIKQVEEILPGHPWPMIAPAKRLPGEDAKSARRFNPGSPDQVRTVLQHQGVELPVDRKSRTGKGSTSARNLKLLLRKDRAGDPFLTTLLDRRAEEKILGTYAKPLAERSHTDHPYTGYRVFPIFHLHKTLSGRLASSDPNIQNQPKLKSLRRSYVPSGPGRILTQVDYGQAELRVMAALGHDDFLRSFFRKAADHAKKKGLGIGEKNDMDLFNTLMPLVFPDIDFEANPGMLSEKRRQLKATVYGVSYDRGARDLAEDLDVPQQYAQFIIDSFLRTVPGVTAWREGVITKICHGERLVTRFGRYLLHEAITEKNVADINRRALSFLPQSSASDCCLLAAIKLGEYIRKNKLNWDISALIHDAIVSDVPEDEVDDAIRITGQFMLDTAAEWFPEVPFAVEGSKGYSWAEL